MMTMATMMMYTLGLLSFIGFLQCIPVDTDTTHKTTCHARQARGDHRQNILAFLSPLNLFLFLLIPHFYCVTLLLPHAVSVHVLQRWKETTPFLEIYEKTNMIIIISPPILTPPPV